MNSVIKFPFLRALIDPHVDMKAFSICQFMHSRQGCHSSCYKSGYDIQHPLLKKCIEIRASIIGFSNARNSSNIAPFTPLTFLTAIPITRFPQQLPNPHVQVLKSTRFPRMNQIQSKKESSKLSQELQGSPPLAPAHHHYTDTETSLCTLHYNHTTRARTQLHSPFINCNFAICATFHSRVTSASTSWSPSHVNDIRTLMIPELPSAIWFSSPVTSASLSWIPLPIQ